MEGFCCEDVKPFGPVQEYKVPPLADKFKVPPAHWGLLLDTVAINAVGSVMVTDAESLHPPAKVNTALYKPGCNWEMFGCEEWKLPGPVQKTEMG